MIVTLLTDFGDQDGFVGAMRGVILSRAPQTQLIDLAHHLAPGDREKASRVLMRSVPHFPQGSLHLIVVDPGVGSDRAAVAVRAAGQTFVAPDNGVLTDILEVLEGEIQVHQINPELIKAPPLSATFHGRDLFAPAAGFLAAGGNMVDLGPPCELKVKLRRFRPEYEEGLWRGHVIEVDRFGNLITNLPVSGPLELMVGSLRFRGPAPYYAAAQPGHAVLVLGSEGTLELAVRGGSAAQRFGLGVGVPVSCRLLEE